MDTLNKRSDATIELIAHRPVGRKLLLFTPRRLGWVWEGPVLTGAGVGEGWTGVVRGVADRDHIVKLLINEPFKRLARLRRCINPDLGERLQCERADQRLLGTRTLHLDAPAGARAQQRLRHLRAGGVVRAEEEDAWRGHVPDDNAVRYQPMNDRGESGILRR